MRDGLDASTVTPGRKAPVESRTAPAMVLCAATGAAQSSPARARNSPRRIRTPDMRFLLADGSSVARVPVTADPGRLMADLPFGRWDNTTPKGPRRGVPYRSVDLAGTGASGVSPDEAGMCGAKPT